MNRTTKLMLVLIATWLGIGAESSALASSQKLKVLGVIGSENQGEGVVLLKSANGKTFVSKVGQEVDAGIRLLRLTREYVYFQSGKTVERVRVGEEMQSFEGGYSVPSLNASGSSEGIERTGNSVKVAASYRDEVLKNQLSKVMMQAAAVPHYENGALLGFRLWEIDPGSIYERAGLMNGDIVTALNGQALSDVGRAVKILQSLKEETRIQISVVRRHEPMNLDISVQ